MAKQVRLVAPEQEGVNFSTGDKTITLSPSMSIEDAELVNEQYPGLYLEIIDTTPTKQSKQNADS